MNSMHMGSGMKNQLGSNTKGVRNYLNDFDDRISDAGRDNVSRKSVSQMSSNTRHQVQGGGRARIGMN